MPRNLYRQSAVKRRLLFVIILAGITIGAFNYLPSIMQPVTTVAAAASCSTFNFDTTSNFNVARARGLAIADVNKDGKPDLLATTNYFLGQVSVFLGDGSGGFAAAKNFQVDANPTAIVTADFDKDGNIDFATPHASDLTIWFGDGTGDFARYKFIYVYGGSSPTALATGDFNLDGKPDLAVTYNGPGFTILLGNGDGEFSSIKSYSASVLSASYILVKDFNGDNKPDLALASGGSNSISIMLGDGTGTFGTSTDYAVGAFTASLAAEDFNGDGKIDIASANSTPGNISVLLGDGAGHFASANNFATGGTSPRSIAAGDFDKDGKIDLAAVTSLNNVIILRGDGAGAFKATASYSSQGMDPKAVAVGDLNGDGRPDLAVTNEFNGGVSVRLNNCSDTLPPATLQLQWGLFGFLNEIDGTGNESQAVVTVIRTGSLLNASSVQYATADGTALSGIDYVATAGILNFAEGDTFKNFSLKAIDDDISEGDEIFNLSLFSPSSGTVLGTPNAALVYIYANDGQPTLSVNDVFVTEGNGGTAQAVFSVRLSNPSSSTITVNYSTADGTATAGSDYTAASGTLTFSPGEMSKTVAVPVTGDATQEPNETFLLNIAGPLNALTGKAQGTAAIMNDDGATVAIKSSKIVFASGRDYPGASNKSELYLMNPDGSGQIRLTNNTAADWEPAWSPDGTQIAFSSMRDGISYIYVMNADGSRQRRLTYGSNIDSHPSWSPDGKKIVFVRQAWPNYGGNELYIINADGSNLTKLTNNSLLEYEPEWSPDGKKIVFTGAGNGKSEIYTINPDGTGTTNLTPNSYFSCGAPAWSPDSSKIAFVRDYSTLYLMNADGTQAQALNGNVSGNGPEWSPDGQKLIFSATNYVKEDISVVNIDGTGLARITDDANYATSPDWQPVQIFSVSPLPTLGLSSNTYLVNEADASGGVTVTVNRTGDASTAVSVDYSTSDTSGTTPCQTNVNAIASERCDYVAVVGTLRFASGETTKTIQIPIVDDVYQESTESFTLTLKNPQGVSLGTASAAVGINDNDTGAATTNPIDGQDFFIRQQYIDFLGRVAEADGLAFWKNRMTNCPAGDTCDRIDTSMRFFQSDEFKERGFYVYRLYDAVMGRLPLYTEFVPDTARLSGYQSVEEQRQNKDAYLQDFINKQEFRNIYGAFISTNGATAVDATGFVNALCQKAGITPASKQTLIDNLSNGTKDPAHTIEEFILQPEMSNVGTKFYDRGFITMQYFGYLRRDPDSGGFNFWEGQLMGESAPHRQDYRFMVGGFLQSDEYRFRFALISNP